MKYSDFEKELQGKLSGEEIQLDTTLLLENLKGTNRRKKRWIIPFMALLCLSTIGLFAISSSSKDNTSGSGKYVQNQVPTDQKHKVGNEDAANDLDEIPSVAGQASSSLIAEVSAQFETQDNAEQTTTNNPSAALPTSLSSVSNQGSSSSASIQEEINLQTNEQSNPQNLKATPNSFKSDNSLTNESTTDQTQSIANNSLTSSENITLYNSTLTSASSSRSSLTINDLNGLTPLVNYEEEKVPMNKKIDCPDFRVNKKIVDIEILAEAGYLQPFKSLSSLAPEPNEIHNLRTLNESPREGYHAAIYAKAIGRKVPFYVQAGIGIDHVTERMDLGYSYVERDTTVGIISITKSEGGDTITAIYGDIITEREITGNQRKHYRLQTFDIPILVGYEFGMGRWSLGFDAGVNFNVQMRSSGNILASPISFEEVDEKRPFKSNVGMSIIGGVNLGYFVTPRSRLYLNIRGRAIPNNINRASNTLSQKYNLVGLNLGYGYIF